MTNTIRIRQVMDWRAAFWAGIIAGAVFLLLQSVMFPLLAGATPWFPLQLIASIVLGQGALPPSTNPVPFVVLIGLFVLFTLSVVYTFILAFLIHRWGLLVGVVGGTLFGLGLYVINYYTFTLLFPWFFPMRNWIIILSHILFGAVAGGVYELLETEQFVSVSTTKK